MSKLFKSKDLQSRFDEMGYVIVQVLDEQEIKQFKDLYSNTLRDKHKISLYESTSQNDQEVNTHINSVSKTIFKTFIENTFENYTYFGGAFLVKSPNNSTELGLHQDWSYLDEEKSTAIFLWTALQDVDKNNGTMFIIERSHNFFKLLRTGSYSSHKINRKFIPQRFVKEIRLKAGEALIMSPKLFHGSYPNKSKEERIIATALLTNKDAPFFYYHKKNKDEAEIYSVEPVSYLDNIKDLAVGRIPIGAKLIKTIPYKYKKIYATTMNKQLTGSFLPLELFKNLFK